MLGCGNSKLSEEVRREDIKTDHPVIELINRCGTMDIRTSLILPSVFADLGTYLILTKRWYIVLARRRGANATAT